MYVRKAKILCLLCVWNVHAFRILKMSLWGIFHVLPSLDSKCIIYFTSSHPLIVNALYIHRIPMAIFYFIDLRYWHSICTVNHVSYIMSSHNNDSRYCSSSCKATLVFPDNEATKLYSIHDSVTRFLTEWTYMAAIWVSWLADNMHTNTDVSLTGSPMMWCDALLWGDWL